MTQPTSPQQSSIVVNCQRTHSNLLRITVCPDGLYLFFLNEGHPGATPVMVGEGDFMPYSEYPDFQNIVRRSMFDHVWDADMLYSITVLNEDYPITLAGLAAIGDENLWEPEREPDFINPPTQQQDVA